MRKWNLKWMWILFIFFAGCALAHVPKTDLSKINFGCSMEEVKKEIPTVPIVKTGVSALQVVGTFILSRLDVKKFPDTSENREILGNILKTMEAEQPGWTILLYQNLCTNGGVTPYWFIFDNKNKLIRYGEGDEKVANYAWNCMVTLAFRVNEFLTYAEAEKQNSKGFLKLMKEKNNPYISYFNELWKYRIMLAERLDKKEITEKEFDYLTTQKQNEIRNEVMKNIRENNKGGLTPSQALALGLLLARPHYVPYTPYIPYRPYIGHTPCGPIYNPYPY